MKKSNLKYILIGVAVLLVILGIIYPKKSLNKQQFPANETPAAPDVVSRTFAPRIALSSRQDKKEL